MDSAYRCIGNLDPEFWIARSLARLLLGRLACCLVSPPIRSIGICKRICCRPANARSSLYADIALVRRVCLTMAALWDHHPPPVHISFLVGLARIVAFCSLRDYLYRIAFPRLSWLQTTVHIGNLQLYLGDHVSCPSIIGVDALGASRTALVLGTVCSLLGLRRTDALHG